jgi:hypothetical protein
MVLVMPVQVVQANAQLCLGLWHNIVLVDVVGVIDRENMRGIGDAYRSVLERYEHVACVTMFRDGAVLSSPESQQQTVQLMQELGPRLVHVALVIESRGLVAQLARSALRAFSVLVRGTPMTAAREVDEAIAVIAPLVESAQSPEQVERELKAAVTRMRAEYRPL